MTPLVLLGATGSIGRQTLEVAERLGAPVEVVVARRPSKELAELANRHRADAVAITGSADERAGFVSWVKGNTSFGEEAMLSVCDLPGRTVLNGIVGAAGLAPTLVALGAGNRVALSNKESMVTGGPLVMEALAASGELIPVDSEHSALHQCLIGEHPDDVSALILTASGGPFRGRERYTLRTVTRDEALAHPTWNMGGRITIDSATLMNKGLEVIEAHHLFSIPFDRIRVVVHPHSLVHSAVEFVDGALKAHLGHPDMRVPIQYALTYPRRAPNPGESFRLAGRELAFEEVDRETFPALDLAFQAGRQGGGAPAVLNAADEVAVAAFLEGRIGFLEITELVARAVTELGDRGVTSLQDVLAVDREAREFTSSLVASATHRS